jgi:hypothetical protein
VAPNRFTAASNQQFAIIADTVAHPFDALEPRQVIIGY